MKKLILASIFLSSLICHAQEPLEKHLIKFLKTNTNHSDYAVSFYGDSKLVLSSPIENESKRPKHDLFIADVKPTGQIENKASFGIDNRTVTKTGLSLNKNRTIVYFSAKNKRKGKHQLFKAEIDKNGLWTNIISLPFNQPKYHFTSPALSPDDKKLYFVSDNRGAYGGTDIFVADINDDGSFSTPKNLGNTINTLGNEVTPFVSNKNVLYFSSDGKADKKGGLDVYQSLITDNEYGKPTPIDAPINGANNDFGYIINSENNRGYFSSNRLQGDDNNNLYSFLIDIPLPEDCEQIIAGIVRDKISNDLITGAKMTLFDKDQKEVQQILTDENGSYSITMPCNETFTLIASGESYNKEEHIINTANYIDAPALAANKFLVKDPNYVASGLAHNDVAEVGHSDQLIALSQHSNLAGQDGSAKADLPDAKAIYFDFDKAYIKQNARPQLDEISDFMNAHPQYKIELSAYTDAIGPKSYNLLLSQRRVKSTMRYLNKKGISTARISGKGYGEANITNGCDDDASCTRAQHRKNRRTEFTFKIDNLLVQNTPKKKIVPRETDKKPTTLTSDITAKSAKIIETDKAEKVPEIEMPDLKLVVSNEAELAELKEKGVVVEGTSIINEQKANEIAEEKTIQLTPIKSLLVEKTTINNTPKLEAKQVKLTNDTSHIINIKAMTANDDEYNKLLEKGTIEELQTQSNTSKVAYQKEEQLSKKEESNIEEKFVSVKKEVSDLQQTETAKEALEKLEQITKIEENVIVEKEVPATKDVAPSAAELKKIKEEAGDLKQTETSKETLEKLDQLYKNKEAEKKAKESIQTTPKKTSYTAPTKPTDTADPNELISKVKEKAALNPIVVKKDTDVEKSKEPEVDKPKIEVKTFSVTPMTSKKGKYMQTDRAKKIQALRVIFNLENLEEHIEGYHDAYVVIKSPEGKIINQQGTFDLSNGDKMGFTDETTIFFNNEKIKVVMFIDRIIQKFIKGTYTVTLYANGFQLASSTLAINA